MTNDELYDSLKSLNNVCYSGGAEGADRLFGIWASENGFQEIHFSFDKHKYHVSDDTVLKLPNSVLQDPTVKDKLKKANQSLGRSVPKPGTYVYNLLARNSFQVLLTERVYCIAEVVSPTQVAGGTAWAIQMYIDQYEEPEIYCYDPYAKQAYYYDYNVKEFVAVLEVPTPHGNWTGIGSRETTQKQMDSFVSLFR